MRDEKKRRDGYVNKVQVELWDAEVYWPFSL